MKSIADLIKRVNEIPKIVEQSCQDIASAAQSNAPRGVRVSAEKDSVTASGPMAAWVEFGTGDFAEAYTGQLPNEWDQYAYTFYINGNGGRESTPYLFPAFESERVLLLQRIKEKLNG